MNSPEGFCFSLNCLPQQPGTCMPEMSSSSSSSSESSSVPSSSSMKITALFKLGLGYQASGQLDQAVKIYEQVVESDTEYHDAWYNLGHILEEQNKSSQAVECLREAVRIKPNGRLI